MSTFSNRTNMGFQRIMGLLLLATACCGMAEGRGNDPTGPSGALDGWPLQSWLNPEPLPEVNYAVIRLRQAGLASDIVVEQLDDKGGVLGYRQDGNFFSQRVYYSPSTGQLDVPVLQPDATAEGHFRSYLGYFFMFGPALSPSGTVAGWVKNPSPDMDDWFGMRAMAWDPNAAQSPGELIPFPAEATNPLYRFADSAVIAQNRNGSRLLAVAGYGFNNLVEQYPSRQNYAIYMGEQRIWWQMESFLNGGEWLGGISGQLLNDDGIVAGQAYPRDSYTSEESNELGVWGDSDTLSGAVWEDGEIKRLTLEPAALTTGIPEKEYPTVVIGPSPFQPPLARTLKWAHRQAENDWPEEDVKVTRSGSTTAETLPADASKALLANDRLEILYGNELIRNGVIRPLADHLPTGWTLAADGPKAINRSGMILANAKAPGAQEPEPVLLLPVEVIRKNDNSAYDPNSEALGVSNYVTMDGLPQDSQFNDTCADPENFRLQARVLDPQTNSVQMKLEVIRGGSAVVTHNYTLDKKDGDFVRGRFLRLVTDTSDDAASGAGANSDSNNQTILVRLGDTIKVSYDIAPGSKVEQEIQVGRPSSENNNEAAKPWNHDIRKLKLRLAVFTDANGNPCATDAQINQDIEDANERLAQAGIVIERSNGDAADQLARPAALDDGYSSSPGYITLGTPDEKAVAPLKDNDANTIDVFYVHLLVTDGGRGSSYPVVRNKSSDPKCNNMIIISAALAGGGKPNTLAHETMHVLLNGPHRNDPNTAIFKGGTTLNKNVDGTKRIGPYPDAAAAGVGQGDTTTIRQNAETLP